MFSFTKPIHEIGFTFDLFIGTCLVPPLLVAVSDRDVLEDFGVWTYRPVSPVVIIRFWPLSCDVSLRVLTWGFLETVLGEASCSTEEAWSLFVIS